MSERLVLLSEVLWDEFLALRTKDADFALMCEWGEPQTEMVTFYTPTVTRVELPIDDDDPPAPL